MIVAVGICAVVLLGLTRSTPIWIQNQNDWISKCKPVVQHALSGSVDVDMLEQALNQVYYHIQIMGYTNVQDYLDMACNAENAIDFANIWTTFAMTNLLKRFNQGLYPVFKHILKDVSTRNSLLASFWLDYPPPARQIAISPNLFSVDIVELVADKIFGDTLHNTHWPESPAVTYALADNVVQHPTIINLQKLQVWCRHKGTVTVAFLDSFMFAIKDTYKQTHLYDVLNMLSSDEQSIVMAALFALYSSLERIEHSTFAIDNLQMAVASVYLDKEFVLQNFVAQDTITNQSLSQLTNIHEGNIHFVWQNVSSKMQDYSGQLNLLARDYSKLILLGHDGYSLPVALLFESAVIKNKMNVWQF